MSEKGHWQTSASSNFIGIFGVDVVLDTLPTRFLEVFGRNLNQIAESGLAKAKKSVARVVNSKGRSNIIQE